uniref:Uncharacterized protein n=1 Tax=Globodera rostochiensis TaxID=31243 RepID=A0A914I4W9_GLORO
MFCTIRYSDHSAHSDRKRIRWLIRHRDRTAVSYNRFGRPGEEEEDKPPPTTIFVAPFNENAAEFILFNVCHVQKAAVYFACFGMSMVVLSFMSTFFEFEWYHYSRGVDVTTLLGLFLYLGRARFLLPFIALYSVLCSFELFMCAALLFKVVEPNATVASASGIIVRHPPFAWLLIGMLFILSVQAIMLCTVLRCRHFLSKRELHLMALRVAEKSRQDYPSIQIVVTSGATSAGSDGLSASRINNSSSTIIALPNGRHEVVASFSGSSAAEAPAQQQNADVQRGDQPILKGLII